VVVKVGANPSVEVALQTGRPVVYELVRKPPVEVASVVKGATPVGEPKTRAPSATEVRPVPPYETEREVVATTEPLAFVVRSAEGTLVTASAVVVAAVKSALTKCEVDDAKIPFCAQSGEVVAAERTP
jgi:hypothetical protein